MLIINNDPRIIERETRSKIGYSISHSMFNMIPRKGETGPDRKWISRTIDIVYKESTKKRIPLWEPKCHLESVSCSLYHISPHPLCDKDDISGPLQIDDMSCMRIIQERTFEPVIKVAKMFANDRAISSTISEIVDLVCRDMEEERKVTVDQLESFKEDEFDLKTYKLGIINHIMDDLESKEIIDKNEELNYDSRFKGVDV